MTQLKEQLQQEHFDVLIIGAGPAGSLASVLLEQSGIKVLIVEKQQFPRFSIGESLLPQLMVILEKAGLTDDISAANYQMKNGAAFQKGEQKSQFDFSHKSSPGPGTTYQVKRAEFDKRLADAAEARGATIRYQQQVLTFSDQGDHCLIGIRDEQSNVEYQVSADFVLDASGFGRVLSKLLDLESPSDFPLRSSIFCHIKDNITDSTFDRNKILISVHPQDAGVWYWLIPFSDGSCSFGVVGAPEFFENLQGDLNEKLLACRQADAGLAKLLANAEIITEVRQINGFAANVKSLYGNRYALLGNAGEFLDPVFSSGVTIALKSADLATTLLIKQKNGETICWQKDYAEPLKKGVDVFRVFVDAWYDGRLQDIIFHENASNDVREKICSILAGYAWDDTNPYVAKPARRIQVLAEICKN